jgi:hypothetical protein
LGIHSSTEEIIMISINKSGRAAAALLLSALALSPAVNANCVPVPVKGYVVPVTIATLNKGRVATYSATTLGYQAVGTWYGGGYQLFSDRTGCMPGQPACTPQPFNVGAEDILDIQIKTTRAVTLTLQSQGNAQVTFTGKCDLTTNMLYGSASWPPNTNDTMLLIEFGTPYKRPS